MQGSLWYRPDVDGWHPWGHQYAIVWGSPEERLTATLMLRQHGGPAATDVLRIDCFAVPRIIAQEVTR